MEILPSILLLLAAVAAMSWLSQKVAIPAPVLFSIAGVAWSLLAHMPKLEITPAIVLAVFLPPLLYADAWQASWLDFRRWLRPILQLAIGLVVFTILSVGVVAHVLMPRLPWGACFLLGGIVSMTDTIAVHSVLERLRVPRRATAILGGESLINDATGLLGVELATVVVLSGAFETYEIGLGFARIAGLGVVVGVVVGLTAAKINQVVRGTPVLFTLSLVAPYGAYFLAERVGSSGVLATVIAGFVASWRVHYIAPESRVALYASWEQLAFLLNALMFVYIGLETPARLVQALETMPGIVSVALAVSATVILARFVWIFPNAYLPLWLFPGLRRREGTYPSPRAVMLVSWCGVRGAVSLAAALSLPLTLADGTPFPGREQIVACTLAVILITLVGQGTTLLPLARRLGLEDAEPAEEEALKARATMLAAGIARLDAFCTEEKCPIAVFRLREAMVDQLEALKTEDESERTQARQRLAVTEEVRRAVYEAQSRALLQLRDREEVNDRVHQFLQLDLDRANAEARPA
ncbi:MAG TPA: Na+/H+ antiporter [Candidatus Polarisedimenticolia bacterium]|nr:Na+/H+ antiporter [Candidatus Polarisedimenticolia bacterium]